jgi:hypothetical protein
MHHDLQRQHPRQQQRHARQSEADHGPVPERLAPRLPGRRRGRRPGPNPGRVAPLAGVVSTGFGAGGSCRNTAFSTSSSCGSGSEADSALTSIVPDATGASTTGAGGGSCRGTGGGVSARVTGRFRRPDQGLHVTAGIKYFAALPATHPAPGYPELIRHYFKHRPAVRAACDEAHEHRDCRGWAGAPGASFQPLAVIRIQPSSQSLTSSFTDRAHRPP